MPQTDDAIKVLADTLTKAVEAINKLIDTSASDRSALESAKATISQLEATSAAVDASTAQSLGGLTALLNDLAEKAIAATPGTATPVPAPDTDGVETGEPEPAPVQPPLPEPPMV